LNNRTQGRRYLSTTPIRPAQQQAQTELAAAEEELDDEYYPLDAADIPTQLVYPHSITVAAPSAEVADPRYTPAETAEGLEEVGGLAGWWDKPAHWGSEAGAAQYVRDVVNPFGPAEKITDPAMLEVLGKRAIVEALVVARFAGADKKKAIDRLFTHAEGTDRLGKIVRAEVVAGKNGSATLKTSGDWKRVWDVLKSSVRMARSQQPQVEEAEVVEGEEAAAVEAEAEAAVPEAEANEAAPALTPRFTPQMAKGMMGSWNKGWKKAELRDPVVKFFVSSPGWYYIVSKFLTPKPQAAKRIQQLTGHRIPDGKLLAAVTIEGFLQQLLEPPKVQKLAELVENKAVFKDLANVRVFPRRVTPIDKEQMVGRWKIIVKELEKRELPITGTGDYSGPVEKRWVDGSA
jgi:hypothetical protein